MKQFFLLLCLKFYRNPQVLMDKSDYTKYLSMLENQGISERMYLAVARKDLHSHKLFP
jgi:hypothetical protein